MDGHEAFLQAAGGKASRVAQLVDGSATGVTAFEREAVALARRTYEAPKLLTARDLDGLRAECGDGALVYTGVVGGFHFINRIADLLHVDAEALPESMRRFETLRRLSVRAAAWLFRTRMDLANRAYGKGYEQTCADEGEILERHAGRSLDDAFASVAPRPWLIELLRHAIEERDLRSGLDRSTIARVQQVVEDSLPSSLAEAEGFHPRPADPVEAFAFVGTRYAARTTPDMIERLREAGYDDLGILDLAIAVADANQWARLFRLLELDPALFYLDVDVVSRRAA